MRRWLDCCYPQQIEAVLREPEYQKYTPDELAQMGIKGVRGLKKGVLARRKAERAEAARTAVHDLIRQDARSRTALNKEVGLAALTAEFL